MPREGVPYPERMLCSLKCELKNIWNALSGKLHSVNGVEGDGQGNVNIVSGDAAVVVTTDPSLNQIEVSLDQSQLPVAAVSSVNGETGAVVLDASEIGSSGSSNVQTDINALKAADVTLQGNINAEATARANADSTLQTNINTVTASLPGLASTAVANSPVVQQLVYADQNENLKIADVDQYAVGLTGNQGPITGEKQFLSAYKYIKRITTLSSATPGWRKLWTFSGRCTAKILTMSVQGQYRSVGSTEYLLEFRSSTFNSNQNRQTIIFRSVANDNIVIGATYNQQTGEEGFCIYGRVAAASNETFMIEEAFNDTPTFKTDFAESSDNTSYQLSDIGDTVTIGASL